MKALLEVRDLYVDLGEFSLRGANLAVKEGDYCCLIGDSGAGKSVLLETVIGGFRPKVARFFSEDRMSRPGRRNVASWESSTRISCSFRTWMCSTTSPSAYGEAEKSVPNRKTRYAASPPESESKPCFIAM